MNAKVELLAPAGNMEAFLGAINAGADAIYLAGKQFGARAYADNFTQEELIKSIRYAHLLGRKVYLTVNILMKEHEFSDLYEYLKPLYENGLDAVIVQDLGGIVAIRKWFPDMEVHVSTQATVTGEYAASYLGKLGATRIVPARELSLKEIKIMKEQSGLEIECFIHGAMCYCYSGQCLFSSLLGGRSGNRGRCAGPCRLPYSVDGKDSKKEASYPLSLKDMCSIEILPALIDAGIDSFKIEGRMKKPEYAAGVTAIYRKYIDLYISGNAKLTKDNRLIVEKADMEMLKNLYIRSERQDGYYFKHNGAEMVSLKSPSYSGSDDAVLEKVKTNYLTQPLKLPVSVKGQFEVGQPAGLTFEYNDLTASVFGQVVETAKNAPVLEETVQKQLKKLGDTYFSVASMDVHVSENMFYSLKEINELRRSAVMELEDLIICANGFVIERTAKPYSSNEENLSEEGMKPYEETKRFHEKAKGSDDNKAFSDDNKGFSDDNKGFSVSVETYEQLQCVAKMLETDTEYIKRLYVNGDLVLRKNERENKTGNETGNAISCLFDDLASKTRIYLAMPHVIRKRDAHYMEQILNYATGEDHPITGFLVRNLETYAWLLEKHYEGELIGDCGFYHWNHYTDKAFTKDLDAVCLPFELNEKEQRTLYSVEKANFEKVIYGRIPMMITANWVAKTMNKAHCDQKNMDSVHFLTDRYKVQFPVVTKCMHCQNILYNSVPLSLFGQADKWKDLVTLRLSFTVEDYKDTKLVLQVAKEIYEGKKVQNNILKGFTTGHEKKGVE